MKSRLAICILILITTLSCNLEIDDTDPQSSLNINDSKKNRFFIVEYYCNQKPDDSFRIKEAWIEDSWKYDISSSNVKKIKTGGLQLNYIFENNKDTDLDVNFYHKNLKNQLVVFSKPDTLFNSTMGAGKVFTSFLKSNYLPKTVYLNIGRQDSFNESEDSIKPFKELVLIRK